MSEETRRRILERRARFVAAALGASVSASCDRVNPMVCLEPPPIAADDAKTSATSSATATTSASSMPSAEPDAMPLECLKIAPPPSWHPPDAGAGGGGGVKPKVCLTEMFHDDEEPKG
jgi:hypothetical protein